MDIPDLTLAILRGIRDDIGKLQTRFDGFESKFGKLESRFDKLESRFDKLDAKFDRLEAKVDKHDARFDRLEAKVDRHDARFDEHDARFDAVDNSLETLGAAVQRCVTREEFAMTMRLVDERHERMYALIVDNNARTTAAHLELQDTVHQIMQSLGQHGSLAARVDRCEQDIIDIKDRLFRP